MPKRPKSLQHKDLDSSLVANTLMNLTQRADKTEWRLSDVTTRVSTQETEHKTWRSRFFDLILVGILGLVLILLSSFFFWRHLDSRLGAIETSLTAISSEATKKDVHTETRVLLEKAIIRIEYLEKAIGEKQNISIPVAPDIKPRTDSKPKK